MGTGAAALAVWAFVVTAALAGEGRVALVIGNASYAHVPDLPNPRNDAEDIAAKLEEIGFAVTLGVDLDFRDMRLMLRDFGDVAQAAEVALVYFAGHGIEIDNSNYLIPVNAELRSDRDVELETIALDTVITSVAGGDGLKIVLVDACRNNPFLNDMVASAATRSIGRGLGQVDPGAVLVGYAARSGTLALDGEGRNSPYAQALLEHIAAPGVELGKIFRLVRDSVSRLTNGYQQPFTYGSLPAEDIYLVPAALPEPAPEAATSAAPDPGRGEMFDDFAAAERANTLEGWRGFLRKYADRRNDSLVAIARAKRDALFGAVPQPGKRSIAAPWASITFGPDREAILTAEDRKRVQRALSYMGYDIGTPDGVFGPRTKTAITTARFDNRLRPGALVDAAFVTLLPDIDAIETLRSAKGRKFDPSDLPDRLESRLLRALHVFEGHTLVFDYFRGHLYLAVLPDDPLAYRRGDWTNGARHSWHSAQRLAQEAGGHLATISDAEENRFLSDLFGGDDRFFDYYAPADELNGPHFGLYQLPGSTEPSGGWVWVTGEPVTFRAWTQGHPMINEGNEYAQFNVGLRGRGKTVPLRNWASNTASLGTGFIVEIE